jgi:membrane-associated HD superfamily phosphohydrolase
MPSKSAPKPPRNFDCAPSLSDEARQAVSAAFDAMSNLRTETANASERNLEQVIEKTATAARALGWPEQIVDATRAQFQSITKMQTQTMDQIMDAWEEQIKSPNPSSAMLSKLNSLQSFSWPNPGTAQMAAMNPLQLYMQFAQQWQKSWTEAMAFWSKAGS